MYPEPEPARVRPLDIDPDPGTHLCGWRPPATADSCGVFADWELFAPGSRRRHLACDAHLPDAVRAVLGEPDGDAVDGGQARTEG